MTSHALAALLLAAPALAGDGLSLDLGQPDPQSRYGVQTRDSWHFSLSPYLWVPDHKGDVTVRGRTAPLDLSFGDLFDAADDNLSLNFGLHGEAATGLFSIFADAMYLDLETARQDATGANRAAYTQGILELGGAYTFLGLPAREASGSGIDALAGARVYYLDAAVVSPGGAELASDEQAWIDGFAGLRARWSWSENFGLFGRFDIGAGGSDLAWNLLAGVDARFSRSLSLQVGYRWLDTEFSEGDGADQFAYDTAMHGPFLALSFAF